MDIVRIVGGNRVAYVLVNSRGEDIATFDRLSVALMVCRYVAGGTLSADDRAKVMQEVDKLATRSH